VIPSLASAAPLLAFERGWRLKPHLEGSLTAAGSPPVRAREKIPDANCRAGRGMGTPRYSLREGVTLPAGFSEIPGCTPRPHSLAKPLLLPAPTGYHYCAQGHISSITLDFERRRDIAEERSNQTPPRARTSRAFVISLSCGHGCTPQSTAQACPDLEWLAPGRVPGCADTAQGLRRP
jgi:hypothetical protein